MNPAKMISSLVILGALIGLLSALRGWSPSRATFLTIALVLGAWFAPWLAAAVFA